jgi:FkbM family methyltransferase
MNIKKMLGFKKKKNTQAVQEPVQPQIDSRLQKYQGYMPASNGCEMQQFIDWVKNWSTLTVKNVFEIGANFAQDAEYLALQFNIAPENVYVFEAHPDIYDVITKIHNFHAYNYAVYNKNGDITFNVLPITETNTGLSSILNLPNRQTKPVTVPAIRMDDFMNKHNIEKIDFLKLDVEGCNWDVLDGFGDRLKDVNAVHVEAEHQNNYKEQNHLFNDIRDILVKNGFEMVFFQRYISQSDSFWIQKRFLKEHD